MKHISILALMILFAFGLQAQTTKKGRIAGVIKDAANSEPLIGATATVVGGSGAAADLDGKYLISLEPGTYTVNFKFIGYVSRTIENVVVTSGQTTLLNINLKESVRETEVVVVTTTIKKGSMETMIKDIQNAATVTSGVSAEQMRRTPDKTTADVLKRVSGASIQDNKFAVVRGLSDRYNLGFLNGVQLPSTESDRKAFTLDIIPSFVVDKMVIAKTASPDKPGDFAGGLIDITTRDIPFENSAFITIGGGTHSLTTNKNFTAQYKTGSDVFGLATDRILPTNIISTAENKPLQAGNALLTAEGQKFNHDFSRRSFNANPNLTFQAGINGRTKIFGNDFGYLGAATFSNSYRNINSFQTIPLLGNETALKNPVNGDTINQNISRYNTTSALMGNFSYKIGDFTKISFKNLYTVISENSYGERFLGRLPADEAENQKQRSYIYFFSSNQMVSNQLNVDHYFNKAKLRVNATGGYFYADRQVPDYRRLNYQSLFDTENRTYGRYQLFSVPDVRDFNPDLPQRYYSNLYENAKNANLDITKSVNFLESTDIKAGFAYMERERTFRVRNFLYGYNTNSLSQAPTFFGPDTIFNNRINNNQFYLKESTLASDFYNGKSKLVAAYIMSDMRIKPWLRAIYGVRLEQFNQEVNAFTDEGDTVKPVLDNTDFLPSVNFIINPRANHNLRLGYSRTLSRPEFREFAPVAFYDFNTNAIVVGAPNLVRTSIDNIDLRYEIYSDEGESFSINPFYKRFTNPVESQVGGSGTRTFTYFNAKEANNYGVEFDARITFKRFGSSPILERISLYGNYSLISSTVKIDTVAGSIKDRPLQGQSPYVFNAGLVYQDADKGWDAAFTINRVGRRIAYIGNEEKQIIWENPRTIIDLSISKVVAKKLTIRFVAGDILAQDLVFYQDLNTNKKYDKGGDVTAFRFQNGFTTTLSINYKF